MLRESLDFDIKNTYGEIILKAGEELARANLRRAYFKLADLRGVDLRGVNLSWADLSWADLRGANLEGADLTEAKLKGADLTEAKLKGTLLPHFLITPQAGAFIAYKKVYYKSEAYTAILKLEIPADAKRTSSLVGRKCRASKVKVLAYSLDEGRSFINSAENLVRFFSCYNTNFIYNIGEVIEEPNYSDDIRLECTSGIHFFMTLKEAVEYYD